MEWGEDRVKELKELWESGLSCRLIGGELGCSKNAVIGKAQRLGLPQRVRVSAYRTPKPKNPRFRPRREYKPVQKHQPITAAVPFHVSLIELGFDQCRFPYGEGPYTFCANACKPGSSYCPEHHHIAHFEPPQISEEVRAWRSFNFRKKTAVKVSIAAIYQDGNAA